MTASPSPSPARHVHVAIAGSGFGGLGTAIRLGEAGFGDYLVFEKSTELGGVWRDNTYPGCACDVESHLYSFSFARNPSWSRAFACAVTRSTSCAFAWGRSIHRSVPPKGARPASCRLPWSSAPS